MARMLRKQRPGLLFLQAAMSRKSIPFLPNAACEVFRKPAFYPSAFRGLLNVAS